MNKAHIKEIAYRQQINHLAQAQTQALKILIEEQQPCKLNIENALAYYELVKLKLGPQQFPEFLEIMRENRNPNSDCMVIISKICHLFKNYPELLQGFGMFLPPSINLQVQTAGRFLVKGEKNEIFPLFIKTEDEYDPNRSTESTLTAVSESDSTMEDLPDDNEEPDKAESISKESRESKEIDSDYATNYLARVKDRFQDQPEVYNKFIQVLESVRKDGLENDRAIVETDVFNDIRALFEDNEDLIEEFKFFVPNAKYPEPSEQDPLPTPDDPNSELESQFQNEDSIPFSDSSEEELIKYSAVNDPSLADVAKYGGYNEHLFFDKVREALYHKEVYDNFLKCLMLFNEDVVTRSELLKIATSFLGKFPDLLKEFKDMLGFNESGNNIEAIPLKIIKYENSRLDPEIALDIDYATGGRNGASYRALPKDLKQPKCSGRTLLCKEVLNDTWVSFPSWSEDSTFVTSCKTEFEEMIYRCEDERFELDMAIRANSYTIQVLENVQKKINKMTPEEKSVFSLDDTLGGTSTVLHQKALHRCYGDKTDELVEGLKRNPIVAVPIILKRLRGKEEEWKEKQKHFNNIWREQIDNYYIKSLDHQGINFKQNDSKSFRSKSLLNEMEMVFAEKKENSVANCASFHFLLEFKEKCVFLDAINLICQYLKKLPGIYRDDRRRIELVVRHFIPDFFCFPRTTVVEDEVVDGNEEVVEEAVEEEEEDEEVPEEEEEEVEEEIETEEVEERPQESMEVDNDTEEKSVPTVVPESAVTPKEEVFSDPEESNSIEENEASDESEKNSFIEDSDIFDKLDTVLPTNLPYTLFFVSKSWYVLFRQFHILCERLSRLLNESNRKDVSTPVKAECSIIDDEAVESKPSYSVLISKLSLLLSGAIDYSQFEDEARSLFGIHAFVSFTMDKLILNIVRQLQQIIGDDVCKQCTAFFFQHNKVIANGTYSSPLESAQVEKAYLRKVDRIMNDENCFKVLWHKKELTLTIELIEHVIEHVDDPYEVEKWSNYLDAYVHEDSVSEELLTEAVGLPVFLPRNLRKQKEFWKRKVASVENLWKRRHSPTYLQKNLPELRKRKTLDHSSPIPTKIGNFETEKLDESMSDHPESCTESENVAEESLSKLPADEVSECDKTVDSNKFDDNSELLEEAPENIEEIFDTEMEIDDTFNEFDVTASCDLSLENVCEDSEYIESFTPEKTMFYCSSTEPSTEENIFYEQMTSFIDAEKSDNDILGSNEASISVSVQDEQHIETVAAFHDISEGATNEVIIGVDQEVPEFVQIITVEDSGDGINIVSNTETVDLKDKTDEEEKVKIEEEEKGDEEENKEGKEEKEESKEEKDGKKEKGEDDKEVEKVEDKDKVKKIGGSEEVDKGYSNEEVGKGEEKDEIVGKEKDYVEEEVKDREKEEKVEVRGERENAGEEEKEDEIEEEEKDEVDEEKVEDEEEEEEVKDEEEEDDDYEEMEEEEEVEEEEEEEEGEYEEDEEDLDEEEEEISEDEEEDEDEDEEEDEEDEDEEEEEEEDEEDEEDSSPQRERSVRNTSAIKLRRNRPSSEYVKSRNRRNAAKTLREQKAKNARKELEDFDYATFDYTYFSELSEEDKSEYLATRHLLVFDNTEGKFMQENFKLFFVRNCDMLLYRLNCLTKAKENNQQIYEIKASNFNAWHNVWLDRYVTPSMEKFFDDWFLSSDPDEFEVICVGVNDCNKPPYVPYTKYRILFYKSDS